MAVHHFDSFRGSKHSRLYLNIVHWTEVDDSNVNKGDEVYLNYRSRLVA